MRCYVQDPLEHALAGVRACGRRGYSYYVGICSDPLLRWSEGASRHSDRFDGMIVVSDAATASLEERVIAACQGSLRCLNVGRGGERWHAGIRWLYIAYRIDGLLRRHR